MIILLNFFFKNDKIIINNYGFRLKFKTIINDFDFKLKNYNHYGNQLSQVMSPTWLKSTIFIFIFSVPNLLKGSFT